jgi:hypothetical protein
MFAGHLAVEKVLKANCAAKMVPVSKWAHGTKGHNLSYLASLCGVSLTTAQQSELITITSFNIEARYDDVKRRFYALCTPKFAAQWAAKISALCKRLKQNALDEKAKLPNNKQVQ